MWIQVFLSILLGLFLFQPFTFNLVNGLVGLIPSAPKDLIFKDNAPTPWGYIIHAIVFFFLGGLIWTIA